MIKLPRSISAVLALTLMGSTAGAAPVPHTTPDMSSNSALHLVGAGDYLCSARLFGKKARLWLKADKPVKYQWSNRKALDASMSGNVISIAATPTATLSNVVIGKDTKGNKVIKGDWTFKSNTQSDVVFTCAAK
ncbi:MAG: hypothetical protein AB8B82_07985 [Roseovarius sp.]